MPATPDVRASDAVDAAWMTMVLELAGIAEGRVVTTITPSPIGTGQVGENVRFALDWDRPGHSSPTTVVAKFPSTSDVSRTIAHEVGAYVKEVGFYRELQQLVTVPTPAVHHVGWEPEGQDFVLVMEDVAPAEQGDQIGGCDIDRARLAVDAVVGLHAPTWGLEQELETRLWVARGGPEGARRRAELLSMLTPGFLDRYAPRLSVADLDLAAQLAGHVEVWAAAVAEWGERNGWCLTHGDYRLDNMLFGAAPDVRTVTVVDWQTVSVGVGPVDVAYFCGAGLAPEDRVRHERRLVARYATALRTAGVGVAESDVWDAYVLGSASGLLMAVVASQVVERTERGDEMFAVMAERHVAQIRDVGLCSALGLG